MAEIEYLGGKEAHVQDDVTSKDPTRAQHVTLQRQVWAARWGCRCKEARH